MRDECYVVLVHELDPHRVLLNHDYLIDPLARFQKLNALIERCHWQATLPKRHKRGTGVSRGGAVFVLCLVAFFFTLEEAMASSLCTCSDTNVTVRSDQEG